MNLLDDYLARAHQVDLVRAAGTRRPQWGAQTRRFRFRRSSRTA